MHESALPHPALPGVVDRRLPTVGHRYELRTADRSRVVVDVHDSGRRDLFLLAPGREEPDAAVTLTKEQARTLAAILGGPRPRPRGDDRG